MVVDKRRQKRYKTGGKRKVERILKTDKKKKNLLSPAGN